MITLRNKNSLQYFDELAAVSARYPNRIMVMTPQYYFENVVTRSVSHHDELVRTLLSVS